MPELPNKDTEQPVSLSEVFAIVGCDGTGKSNLTLDLTERLRLGIERQ